MFRILTKEEMLRNEQKKNKELQAENNELRAITEYIAICDHPEIFEEDDDE